MVVYEISNFNTEVTTTLTPFIYTAMRAEYWVYRVVNFNSDNKIKSDASLNNIFRDIDSFIDKDVYYFIGGETDNFDQLLEEQSILSNITFRELGALNKNNNKLFTSDLYTPTSIISTLSTNSSDGFITKIRNLLNSRTEAGIATKMTASINSEYNTDDEVPQGSTFGYIITRNLDLPGTGQDQEIRIGVVLKQQDI
jgi:hypothetical protein